MNQKQDDNTERTVTFSTEQIKKLSDAGYIPKELSESFFEDLEETNHQYNAIKKFFAENPKKKLTSKELENLSAKKTIQKTVKNTEFINFLLNNPGLLEPNFLDELPAKLFKKIQKDEFGISRIVADPLNNVPEMLESFSEPQEIREENGCNIYMIESKKLKNSLGDILAISHRYRATTKEEADKKSLDFRKRINGRQKKVFEACWAMATKKNCNTYSCSLAELMQTAYPKRKNDFSVKERVEFYQDLIDLSETKITVVKNNKSKKRKKGSLDTYILPLITILKESGAGSGNKPSERYPNQLSISVLHNQAYENEVLCYVAAGIKYTTLELHAKDIGLAEWLQIKKGQLMGKKYLTATREKLVKVSGLQNTQHKGVQNKKLVEKLGRIKKAGIIKDHPKKIEDRVYIKIR